MVHLRSLLFSHYIVSDSFEIRWAVAFQAPLSMGFLRQEHWSGLPSHSPGDFPVPRIKPMSPALAGGFFITEPPGKPPVLDTRQNTYSLLSSASDS